ncbi:UDP-glucuronosyltransferase 2B15 [Camponotus floridanus]|uniref:UDP-glucuronosyltransferase n=1 Tax=Camponotus floridanus TaxID=104421 RepID=E2B1V7_CAMFO|nr:UDP-glucuronosyltransferase 2B15 [Camponotus floridanus]
MRMLKIMFLWSFCLSVCHGYRLLGLFPFHGKSHFVMFEQLMKGLARKGHQIDVISTFPLKKPYPNYTDIVKLTPPHVFVNNVSYEFMQVLLSANPVYSIATMAGNDICKHLENPAIQELARNPPKDPPYDAVLMEVFGAQCFAIFPYLWDVPLIAVSTTALYPWLPPLIAQPENLAFVPNNKNQKTWLSKLYFNYLTREQSEIIRKHFGPNLPGIRELETKIALMLINSHFALNGIQPKTPAAVDVGGLHIQDEDSTLQPELEEWINDSKDGFIYFTFGSMVMIETFPREFLNILYASLSKIAPIRVLMKIPNPEKLPPGVPKNIYMSPWMPQIKILKHPKIRAFITHGGLLGTLEAIAYGVPMIGIPLFADQFMNIDAYVARNIAVKLDLHKMTEKDMDRALNAILWDPIYKETVRNFSQIFLDRPLNALDTAIYWIEYVIKYGSNVLRSPAMDLTWWELSLLDVFAFLLFCAAIIIMTVVFIVNFLLKILNGNDHNSLHSKKNN